MWRKIVDPRYNQTSYLAGNDASVHPDRYELNFPMLGILHGKEGFEYQSFSGNYTIHVIQSGSGTYTVDNKKYIKRAGDLFVTWPGQRVHCIDNNDGTLLRYMWTWLTGTKAAWALEQCGFTKADPHRPGGYHPGMKRVWDDILQDFVTGNTGTVSTVSNAWKLIRAMVPAGTPQEKRTGTGSLGNAVDFILKTSPLHQVTVAELADRLGMDRSTLCRQFNRELGIPPKTYIDNKRLEFAAELLRTTRLRAQEVAFQCGFGDPCYFSRVFKERYGMAPGAWRKQCGV